jgi:phospholipid/cholesterol/gamma-HCH transport system ATP-binding protein
VRITKNGAMLHFGPRELKRMIRLEAVHKSFGAAPLVDGIDLSIGRGETWGLIGPGASGKSVLLKMMCGLVQPDRGAVRVADRAVSGADEDALFEVRALIGMLFQNNALFDFMTVGENVAFPLVRKGELPPDEIRARARERLRAVGLGGSEDKFPSQLSGGMKKRAALARAVVARPPIVIFDEPTAGLDPVTTSKIYDLLRAERDATGATVVAVSSDVEALRRFAPRMAMLYRGQLRYDGPTDGIADSDDPVVRQFVSGAVEGPL